MAKLKTISEFLEKMEADADLKLLTELASALKKKDETIKSLRKDNNRLEKELENKYAKDTKIKALQKNITELKKECSSCFNISEDEQKAINSWKEKHIKDKHDGNSYAGAIGGRFSYKFTPTGIGVIGEVICSCGESFVFRDIS